MIIKFLKAGSGDCILIQHLDKNILIDGGNDSKYLLKEVDTIYSNDQIINLLVVTHHDDDHIKGIIDLFEHIKNNNYGNNFVEKVIFNSPRLVLGKIKKDSNQLLSYKQAFDLEEILNEFELIWEKTYTDEDETISFEDLKLTFLSPTKKDIFKYSEQKGAYLTSDYRCDWEVPMIKLEKSINDDSQDKSIPNKSSIVLKVECDNKKILLTGDVTPDRLEVIVNKLVDESATDYVTFDYIKLPHHGSYRSLNKNILDKIKCKNYIISTNGKKYFLPNKRALLKILTNEKRDTNEKINFIFNYEEALQNLKISFVEKSKYKFDLINKNTPNGISI